MKMSAESDPERKQYYLVKCRKKERKLSKLLWTSEPTPASTPVTTKRQQYSRDNNVDCSICGKVGLDTGNLQDHIIRVHIEETNAEVFQNALVRTISARLRGQWLHRLNDGTVACTASGCGARLKTPRSLRLHIVNVHSDLDAEHFKTLLERTIFNATTTATTSTSTTATTTAVTSRIHSRIQSVFDSDSETEPRAASPTPSPVTPVRLRAAAEPEKDTKAAILQENARLVNAHRDSFEEMQRIQWQLWQDGFAIDEELRVCRDPVSHEKLKTKKAAQTKAADAKLQVLHDAYKAAEASATHKIDALFEAYKLE